MDTRIIGVDLGGTRMRVAVLDEHCNLLHRVEQPTRAHEGVKVALPRLLDLVASVVDEWDEPITGIGVSSPAPIDPATGEILSPPNLPGWHRVAVGKEIEQRTGITTFPGNDANVAALAEVYKGAARGHTDAVYITVSTGIGGGVVLNGRLFVGGSGLGGEIGHIVILADGERVSTLELEAAGPALARRARALIEQGAASLITELVAGDLSAIEGATVGQAAQQGDPLALEIVERAGRIVGYGITTLMHILNPTIFVVGGGVTKLGDLLFTPMRQAACEQVIDPQYCKDVAIVPAELGDDVAIIGAATLALTELDIIDLAHV